MVPWTESTILIFFIYIQKCSPNTLCSRQAQFSAMNKWSRSTFPSVTTACSNVTFENGPLENPNPQDFRDCQFRSGCQSILEINSSVIPTLPASAFEQFSNINKLYIKNAKIQTILPAAFNSLNSLRELSLSNNNLTEISEGIFTSLSSLKILDLSRNNIRNLSIHSLAGINLEVLNLSFNALRTFSEGYFTYLKVNLLDLSFNQLIEFNFTGADKVRTLNLSDNHIKSLQGCITPITVLNLSRNEIDSLNDSACVDMNSSNIYKLDLSYNFLSDLNSKSFSKMNKLQYLSLQNSNISFIPNGCFSDLVSLRFLNLSSNDLDNFEYGLFGNMKSLRILDISNNRLSNFKKSIFYSLRSLYELYVQRNEIGYLNTQDMKRYLPYLRKINLDRNNFSCETLIEIFHELRSIVIVGKTVNTSNINGVTCSEDYTNYSGGQQSVNTNISQVVFDNNFQSELSSFKNSNFFKYLESLKMNNDSKDIYSYFNASIENFYNYMEDLNKDRKAISGFGKDLQDYFDNGFRNSNFVKYLDSVGKSEDTENKNFENSKFYKYMEMLRSPDLTKRSGNENSTVMEKLVSGFEESKSDSYYTLLVLIMLALVLNSCLLAMFLLVTYRKVITFFTNDKATNEEVELLVP